MAKRNRGKVLHKLPSNGRGNCPLCNRTGVKLLYNFKTDTRTTIQVCKHCRQK